MNERDSMLVEKTVTMLFSDDEDFSDEEEVWVDRREGVVCAQSLEDCFRSLHPVWKLLLCIFGFVIVFPWALGHLIRGSRG